MRESFFERGIEKKFPERVYYVESEQDNTVLIAINVTINSKDINWFDGTKERIMQIGQILQDDKTTFSFERADGDIGAVYNLSKMTLSVYDEKVKGELSVPEEFYDEEEMIKSFESTINSAW